MEDKDKKIADLTAQVSALQIENAQLKKDKDQLANDSAQKDKDLADATKIVTELKAQLAEKKAGSVELPTVTLNKDTYELVGGDFLWKGREISLDVLKEDAKLVAELVKEGVSALRKLGK